jgi:beta-glucosidase
MKKEIKFPKNFLWGSATSAYQVEGGNKFSDWEISPPKKGHGPAGIACDHYNRFKQDFDLLKELNQNAHRFSIEWARIEPKQGEFNKAEIEHYREVLKALKQRGVKAMVTLHHFTLPQWVAEIGGFANKKTIQYFQRYAEAMLEEYKDLVDFWITINEPMVYAGCAYIEAKWPPQKKSPFLYFKVIKNFILAHKKVYQAFHGKEKETLVGIAKNNILFESYNRFFLHQISVKIASWFINRYFLNQVKKELDFIGLNYYFHNKIKFPWLLRNENKVVSDMGWELYPEGIYNVLKESEQYNKPIYITENGLADAQDKHRSWFIESSLKSIHKAVEEGANVGGYFYWSLMDNFEWADGFASKFGLIEIDYQTLKRKPRPSAYQYANICQNNKLV